MKLALMGIIVFGLAGALESSIGIQAKPGRNVRGVVTGVSPVNAATYDLAVLEPGNVDNAPTVPRRVVLSGPGGVFDAPLQTDGSFELANVPSGSYSASVKPLFDLQSGVWPTVTVGGKDLDGIRIALTAMRIIRGRVVVTGGGPLPLLRFSVTDRSRIRRQTGSRVFPDGSFHITVPDGELSLELDTSKGALPDGYQLKSFRYGATDLASRPRLNVSALPNTELRIEVAVTSTSVTLFFPGDSPDGAASPARPDAWVRVSGRLLGRERNDRFTMGILRNDGRAVASTMVNPDGSFEFPKVLRDRYILRAVGAAGFVLSRPIEVKGDMTGEDFVIPRRKQVTGRVVVEGGGIVPRSYWFQLSGGASSVGIVVIPACSGTFTATLPEGEHRLTPGLPERSIRSFNYGATNLLKKPLNVAATDTAELIVTFEAGATAKLGIQGSMTAGFNSGLINGPPVGEPRVPLFMSSTLPSFQPAARITAPPAGQGMVSGCVVIDNRPDVPIPPISLTFTGASRADAAARPDGVFRIDLPEGKYRVAINALPPGFSLKSIKINTTDLLRSPLNVNSAALPGIVVHLEQNAGAAPPRK